MADISKAQLRKEIAAILKNADLTKTSSKKVRTELEEKLDVDLTDQKKTVDDLVMEYLNSQEKKGKKSKKDDSEEEDGDDAENGDDDEEEDEESEEEVKKKAPKRAAPKKKKASSDSDEDASGDDAASDDEYSPKKKAKPAPKKKGGRKKKGSDGDSDDDWGKKKKRGGGGGKGGGGYTKPLTLSKDLAKLMGQDAMPRHEVVKRMWALIKERNLYDPKNKQFAICDAELLKVIGEKRFRIFGMMKYLKEHFSSGN